MADSFGLGPFLQGTAPLITLATCERGTATVSGYQDIKAVLIAVNISTVTINIRENFCIALENGETRQIRFGSTYPATVTFATSGVISFTYTGSQPAETKLMVFGF